VEGISDIQSLPYKAALLLTERSRQHDDPEIKGRISKAMLGPLQYGLLFGSFSALSPL